jgi:hypothetical protein
MNLLDRLKPEYLEKLELTKEQFPQMYKNVKTILKNKDFYSELTIGEGVSLCLYLDIDFNIGNINELFNE